MGAVIQSIDWSKTPLGSIALWPQSLRTTVSLCLSSNFPISIAWGPHRVQIYNDGYWPVCAAKHPGSMGQEGAGRELAAVEGGRFQKVIKDLQPEMQGRKIILKIDILPSVTGEESMLRQVWANLIGNAVKYTRKCEEALIEIGSRAEPDETVFFIRDNGVGFDPQYADKLFWVFQRLRRSEEFEGTGIGLANVRRVIHRHGGRTWAEGRLDNGAAFYFSLPMESRGENGA